MEQKWTPGGTQKGGQNPSKNRWKFDVFPGVARRSEILAKPKENHGFSRVRGLVLGSVLGGHLGPQSAPKINANSVKFFGRILQQKSSQNGAQNATKNVLKNQWKN